MKASRLVSSLGLMLAGALIWECVRLASLNRDDREDMVDQIIDYQSREHPIDLPVRAYNDKPTWTDRLTSQAAAEFKRCSGRDASTTENLAPVWDVQEIVARRARNKELEQRWTIAADSAFQLRYFQICTRLGLCNAQWNAHVSRRINWISGWEKAADGQSFVPSGHNDALPFVLSLSCGMGIREKQDLDSYPNEQYFRPDKMEFQRQRKLRCAKGERTACP